MTKLFLHDLRGGAQIVQHGGMDVAQLVPCDVTYSGCDGRRLQHPLQYIGFRIWLAIPACKEQVLCVAPCIALV
jgi:hypothetical protein